MMASQEFTQKLYEQAAQSEGDFASAGASGASTPPPDDDEVVDAEIVDDEEGS